MELTDRVTGPDTSTLENSGGKREAIFSQTKKSETSMFTKCEGYQRVQIFEEIHRNGYPLSPSCLEMIFKREDKGLKGLIREVIMRNGYNSVGPDGCFRFKVRRP